MLDIVHKEPGPTQQTTSSVLRLGACVVCLLDIVHTEPGATQQTTSSVLRLVVLCAC